MDASIDEGRLSELMEESQDLQSDAMRSAKDDLANYVEASQEAAYERSRSEGSRYGVSSLTLAAAGLAGVGLVAATAGSAHAADSMTDIQALQTAASLENLAVSTYKTALTLPFIGGSSSNGVVKAFAEKTMAQHAEHGQAFNAAAVKLGGKMQTKPDPKYLPIVQKAVPTLKDAADVVGLAITLEDIAAQTYIEDVSKVSTPELRQLFSSVAGVEAQHKSILLAVQALVKANEANLIALPPNGAKLPAAAGSVGFPDTFYPTKLASPVDEGAVS